METIKEEKKADLEQLLNSLIERGWLPFGESRIDEISRAEQYAGNWNWCCWGSKDAIQRRKSTRQLVSKESGLWQFCCENELLKPVVDIISICSYSHFTDDHDDGGWGEAFPEYRIIESALKDESELEEFLLSNIVIKDEKNIIKD